MEKYELLVEKLYSYICGRMYKYRNYNPSQIDFLDDYDRAEYKTLDEIKEFVIGNLRVYERDKVDKD